MVQKAAVYGRRSTTRQELSLAMQEQRAEELAQREGLVITHVFMERVSASHVALEDRVQGKALLDAARRGEFQALIVYKRDRLFRQEDDAILMLAEFATLGLVIYFTDDAPLDLTSDLGPIMEVLRAHLSAQETRKTSDRVTDAIRLKASRFAYLPSFPPYGYRWRADREGYEIVESAGAVVERIYELCIEGMGKATIVETLNSQGIEIRNRQWSMDDVHKVLHNPAYKGVQRVTVGGELYEGPSKLIPPIISAETWELAKESRAARRPRKGAEYPDVPRLAAGLVICGQCGLPLRVNATFDSRPRSDGTIVQYDKSIYRCTRSRDGRCGASGVSCTQLDQMLRDEMAKVSGQPATDEMLEATMAHIQELEKHVRQQFAQLEQAKQVLENRIVRKLDALPRTPRQADQDRLHRQIAALDVESQELQSQIEALQEELVSNGARAERAAYVRNSLASLPDTLRTLDVQVQRDLLKKCFRAVWYSHERRVTLEPIVD